MTIIFINQQIRHCSKFKHISLIFRTYRMLQNICTSFTSIEQIMHIFNHDFLYNERYLFLTKRLCTQLSREFTFTTVQGTCLQLNREEMIKQERFVRDRMYSSLPKQLYIALLV